MSKKNNYSKSLKLNIIYMFIANFIYALSNWAQLSLVSKMTDGIILGNYTLAIAVVTPIYLFLNMQLRALMLTDNKIEYLLSEYFTFRLTTTILLIILTTIICFIFNLNYSILLSYALLRSIEGIAEIFNSKSQQQEDILTVSKSISIKSIFALLGFIIGLYFFKKISIGFFIAIILNLLVLFFFDFNRFKEYDKYRISKFYKYKRLLLKTLPLGVVILIISLNSNISKFYIEYYIDTYAQGIYSSLSYCIILGSFVANAIGQTIAPRLSKYYHNNELILFCKLKNKFILINTLIGLLAILFAILFGKDLLSLLFNKIISTYTYQFVLIMISGLFIYIATALGYILTSMREFKIQPYINFTILFINIIASFLLIPKYGIDGAIYTTICIYIIQDIITYYIIKIKYNKHVQKLN